MVIKMRNKPGFTLIEMMVAIVITSILGGMLLTIFLQTQRSVNRINETIDVDFEDSIIYNQLEKDISGIFVPQLFVDDRSSESKKEKPAQPGQPPKQAQPPKPKRKLARVKDALVSANEGKSIKNLSFITNNPLQVYGESKPRMVRVEYYLEPDENNSKQLKLYRRESNKIEMAEFKDADPRSYQIAAGVKQFSLEFYAAKQPKKKEKKKEDEKKKEGEEARKEVPELVPFAEWNDSTTKENKELYQELLPIFLRVDLELWESSNPDEDQSRKYTFFYHVFAFDSGVVQQPKQAQPPAPPQLPQGQAGQAQGQGAAGPPRQGQRPTGQRPMGQRPTGQRPGGQRPAGPPRGKRDQLFRPGGRR